MNKRLNSNIDIFENSYEESVCCFKRLENLERIRRTNGPTPAKLSIDNKKSFISVRMSSKHPMASKMFLHYYHKNNHKHNTAYCRAIG
jgi:hypothetical protein